MYKLNGDVFDINKEHLIGGVNYPKGWFSDVSNREAMGITEEADISVKISDWFWIAPAGIYSSKLGIYVTSTHIEYVSFVDSGKVATNITEEELALVLQVNGIANWQGCYTDINLATVKTSKEAEIRVKGSSLMSLVVTPYTPEERDTWAEQVQEALAYQADPLAETPMLSALVASRGNTVADQVTRILSNRTAFKTAVGQVLGIQQAIIDQIVTATTVAEVNAITWEA